MDYFLFLAGGILKSAGMITSVFNRLYGMVYPGS
jgi:hypothetical protein